MFIQIILFWQPVDLNSLTHWMSGTASTFLELIQKTFLMELWRTQPPWKITYFYKNWQHALLSSLLLEWVVFIFCVHDRLELINQVKLIYHFIFLLTWYLYLELINQVKLIYHFIFLLTWYLYCMFCEKKLLPSVLWHCWLGGRKGIQPVKKTEWWGFGMVICLEQGADLHMAQLMPLPLTVSCFSKIQIGFTFLLPAHLGSPRKRAVKRVCVSCETS